MPAKEAVRESQACFAGDIAEVDRSFGHQLFVGRTGYTARCVRVAKCCSSERRIKACEACKRRATGVWTTQWRGCASTLSGKAYVMKSKHPRTGNTGTDELDGYTYALVVLEDVSGNTCLIPAKVCTAEVTVEYLVALVRRSGSHRCG